MPAWSWLMACGLALGCARGPVVIDADAAPEPEESLARFEAVGAQSMPPAGPTAAPGPGRQPAGTRTTLRIGIAEVGTALLDGLLAGFDAAQERCEIVPSLEGSLDALARGALDLVVTTTPLDYPHRRVGLRETPFAAVGFAVIVHPSNTVSYLNPAQVAELVDGGISRWTQLNRSFAGVQVLTAEGGDGMGPLALRALFPGRNPASGTRTLASWDMVVDEVARDLGGFALVPASRASDPRVKVLSIDSVLPLPATIRSGSYALSVTLRFVHSDRPGPATLKFLSFAGGPQGQALLARRAMNLR